MAYRDVILADGPSNYWRLNEPSGTVATDLVGGANGTISGSVTLAQPGATADGDKAMTFNGTTGKVQTVVSITVPLIATVEAWIKTVVSAVGVVFDTRTISTGNTIVIYKDTSNKLVCASGAGTVLGLRVVNDGQWHHVVITMNGSTGSIYIDGVVDNLNVAFVRTIPSTGPASIAGDQVTTSFWLGSLDDVAIYPVALTPAQIANHYASAFALSVPSGGADDDDEDDDDEARFRLQEFYGSIAGSVHVAASDSGLIPLVPARLKHTLFVQRLAPVVTTGGPASWTVQDGALPPVPLLTAPASAVAVLPVRDFGANGVPCTEGAPLLLNLSAAGAAGWLTWEGYRKLTGVETLPSATPPHYRDLVIADGASNYWRLNEPSGLVAVDQIGGANGTISGGVTLNQPGALADGDTAMTFNGTTGKILTASNVATPAVITIEAWVKTTSLSGVTICSLRTAVQSETVVFITSGQRIQLFDAGGTCTGTRLICDGQWHHVACRFPASGAQIYIDGVFDPLTAGTAFVRVSSTSPVSIGVDQIGLFLNGSLDEVAIYPVALTPAQIAAHYAARANL